MFMLYSQDSNTVISGLALHDNIAGFALLKKQGIINKLISPPDSMSYKNYSIFS